MSYGRAIKYYVVYFLIFSLFAWLRFHLADMGWPPGFRGT